MCFLCILFKILGQLLENGGIFILFHTPHIKKKKKERRKFLKEKGKANRKNEPYFYFTVGFKAISTGKTWKRNILLEGNQLGFQDSMG